MGGYDTTYYRSAPLDRHPTPTPIFLQGFRSLFTSRTSRTEAPLLCAVPCPSSQRFLHVRTPRNCFARLPKHPAYVTHKKRINLSIPQLVPHFAPFAHFCTFLHLCLFCCAFGPEMFHTYPNVTDLQISINKPPDQCIFMMSLDFIVLHLHLHERCWSPRPFRCAPIWSEWSYH